MPSRNKQSSGVSVELVSPLARFQPRTEETEFIDYKTSMITDEDPLRGLLFYQDLGFSIYTF